MFSDEHLYSIALRNCLLIGDINFRKLVSEVGSAKEVWKYSKAGLKNINGIGKKISKEIGEDQSLKFAEKELVFCEKNNIKVNLRHLGEIPKLLNECEDAPAILYQKGNYNEDLKPISIVGTREITTYGKNFVAEFLDYVKANKIVTISGLALGADTEAHEKSLEKNIPTIAVLAHGFHTLYPSKNKKLSEKILENDGVLFTEFNSTQKPDRENFIQRNRIIAGLSPSIIVVESAFGGGSMSTATFANNYNREVYALPGKISDKYSQGCNQLIFQNKATVISTIKDLVDRLGFNEVNEKTGQLFPSSEVRIQLPENQQELWDTIHQNPNITLDDLSEKLSLPSHKLLPKLLELELLGAIKSLSGRQFLGI